jgi:predicted nuclease of predicted toxin-antitoxin system
MNSRTRLPRETDKEGNLLFDENLPPRLADVLQSESPGSIHVHSCGMESADDEAIWEFAGRLSFMIVSKDSDFQERSVLRGSSPNVIWLRIPNSSTTEIAALIPGALPVILEFIADPEETLLVLSRG